MVLLDMTVLSVAEPDLSRSLHSSVAGLQWAITGYTVPFGALLLSAGAAADRYGAHRLFRAGTATFGLGSLLCALAPNVWILAGLRGVLGVAAAAVVPASMAMIATLFPDPAARAKAVAGWAAISGSALAAGPIVGGFLTDLAGWRAVFWINGPLAAITVALTAGRAVRCPRGQRRIDWRTQFAACAVVGLLADALIALGSGSARHAAASGAALVVAVATFWTFERRSSTPVLLPAVIRAPGVGGALLAGTAVNVLLSGVLFVLPLLWQQNRHMTAIEVGVALLPMTVPFAFNPLVTGRIVARIGPQAPARAGLVLLAGAGIIIGGAVSIGMPYPLIVVGLVGAGFGVSLALPALVTGVVAAAPTGTAGAAAGMLNAARQVGATFGVAVMGAFVTVGHASSGRGVATVLIACGLACAAAGFGLTRPAPGP